MATNLIEQFKSSFEDTIVRECSGLLGESAQSISSSIDAIVPSLFGFMILKGSSDQGVRTLLDFITNNKLNEITLSTSGTEELVANGPGVLNYLVGNQLSPLIDSISSQGGLKTSSSSTLLKIVAPLVMGYFGRMVKETSLNVSNAKELLISQREFAKRAAPKEVDDLLSFPPETTAESSTVSNMQMTNSNSPAGMSKLLPWIVLLLTSLGLFYFLEKGCNTTIPVEKMAPTETRDTI